ncbi:TPA: glycosyltransferase family 2 protein [Vibrio cholerae]|nr:putative glycosyltransferase [Vibrio mimicus]HAS3607711.1 glycosyltransferase family 2 protein [Vibrio cholerae]
MHYDVILCTFNGDSFIDAQLESILLQEQRPKKIIISDDGSTDETIRIARDIFDKHGFENYQFVKGPMSGVVRNFFEALKYCTSEFVFLSDQDDIWVSSKVTIYLEKVKSLDLDSQIPQLYFSDANLIDECGQLFHNSFFGYQGIDPACIQDGSILYRNCVQGATILLNDSLRKEVLRSLEIISCDSIAMHDWWIALLACSMGRAVFIEEKLIKYRQHRGNLVGAKRKRRMIDFICNFGCMIRPLLNVSLQILAYQKYTKLSNIENNLYNSSFKRCSFMKVIIIRISVFFIKHFKNRNL